MLVSGERDERNNSTAFRHGLFIWADSQKACNETSHAVAIRAAFALRYV